MLGHELIEQASYIIFFKIIAIEPKVHQWWIWQFTTHVS